MPPMAKTKGGGKKLGGRRSGAHVRGYKSLQVMDVVAMLLQRPHQPTEIADKLDSTYQTVWRLLQAIGKRFELVIEEDGAARLYSIRREEFVKKMGI